MIEAKVLPPRNERGKNVHAESGMRVGKALMTCLDSFSVRSVCRTRNQLIAKQDRAGLRKRQFYLAASSRSQGSCHRVADHRDM